MKSDKKTWLWLFGLAVFGILLWKLNLRESLHKLAHLDLRWFVPSIILIVLTQFLGYQKWKIMYGHTMQDKTQPLLPIFCSILIGGMLTPARTGDVLASLTWKEIQGKVLAWSIFHRISEGVTTILLSFLVLGIFFRAHYAGGQWVMAFLLFGMVLAGVGIVLNRKTGKWFFGILKKILKKMDRLPAVAKILSFEEKIKQQFELFYQTLSQFQAKHILGSLVFVTLASRVTIVAANVTLLHSLGVTLSVVDVLGILAATWVGAFLSFTPNGIGLGDLAPSLMLSHLGFQQSAGAFILLNRMIDLSILFFWSMSLTRYAKDSKVNTASS